MANFKLMVAYESGCYKILVICFDLSFNFSGDVDLINVGVAIWRLQF